MARHPGAHSAEFYRNQRTLLDGDDDRCRFCWHRGARQVEHIRQRRHGGGDDLGNLTLAHGHDDRRGRSGIDYRCFECSPLGVACNQAYRNRAPVDESYRSRDW